MRQLYASLKERPYFLILAHLKVREYSLSITGALGIINTIII